jgi:xylan 1,4-beta-xylosidase
MITLTPKTVSAPLRRPWKNGIAVGRAYDLMHADLLEHLGWLQRKIGFRSCRFHAVFHDDMAVVRRRQDGSLIYQWHNVDKVYDSLLALGLKPFVELNSMPAALASGTQTMFHYAMNVTPPRDWVEWHDLVRAFTAHCVERYGLNEVRQWHFEVWNEPNLPAFWSGTKEEYFQLYAHAARAIKSVDAEIRVGGPASSKAHWLADLIGFCHTNNVPLDFISTHLYPQDEFVEYPDRAASPHKLGEFFADVVREARRIVVASPLPHLPIHWTEWNTQLATSAGDVTWGENRYVDSLHGASSVARLMTELDDAADTFIFWVASDIFEEGPIPHSPFSHTYGLITIHGIPKATANAFRLMERLRGPRVDFAPSKNPPPFCGGVATREGESVHILLWNDASPEVRDAPAWRDDMQFTLADDGKNSCAWVVTTSHLSAGAGSPFETWETMGRPANLSPTQLKLLRQAAEPAMRAMVLKPAAGALLLPFSLAPNEVLHVEFRPQGPSALSKTELSEVNQTAKMEAQLGEKSRD